MTAARAMVKRATLVADGVGRMIQDFQQKRVIAGVLSAFLRQAKAVDDAVIDVIEARDLLTATGVHLDKLGGLVGEARKGRSNAAYRLAIAVRIRSNRAQGVVPDVFEIMALLTSFAWSFLEVPYGFYSVQIRGLPAAAQEPMATALSRARPLGHQGELVYSAVPANRTLRFGTVSAANAGVTFLNAGQVGATRHMGQAERLERF